ncbi:GNAT family N-acetyltransferase, partial [Campylobacter coli]|nr:GNAT family N-acetyltransferase [Campylobacter coli]
ILKKDEIKLKKFTFISKASHEDSNVAFALLNHYFAANTQNKFFKLFVEEKNQKAINFYKRAGFCFNHINLKFYRNF